MKKIIFLLIIFFSMINGLSAQTEFPAGDFWSLDAGVGISDILVEGSSFQIILDPKLWLTPSLMIGTKAGVSFSSETENTDRYSNIITFEGQVYLRWNFLRLGKNPERTFNIFVQGGLGLDAAYRGDKTPFDNPKDTRGSLMFDAALGVTIPITDRWHIEPSIRGGYPHLFGFSVTAGYKFRLPEMTVTRNTQQNSYDIRNIPHDEIIRRTVISSVEYIMFGPDIGRYNAGIDHDAESLNEMVLNSIAKILDDNRDFFVRIEGHANPVTNAPGEADELMELASMRANTVADQLRARGVKEEQMIIISFGGTRTITSEHDILNRNRRVELIIMKIDTAQN